MYPIDVPHLEKFCTSHVPHLELFVPHSGPYEMATLVQNLPACAYGRAGKFFVSGEIFRALLGKAVFRCVSSRGNFQQNFPVRANSTVETADSASLDIGKSQG